ncbi:serine/threonine protein kinase-transforming protein raf, putative [Entamoeba invadens IP1]|uniref:Serine/threonine protein kinase-transforming protein raf, putative n=1 Tax=Entamoeba invadens IP1 TaxID=370355 RepID=L7FMB7_ENTIV|nr:serine/threonine protein kinase-transforming protein raf, putative [Entamoeba invadens IP1]ELP90953.1 serine/threonine protein kinase-transforming protein raf, putative [Entamoeba invadens IP1]|eukprot:XP_004257724.1 serine/threonine protein kinase-transforming protein raf, putative [Entamoeba invadens IP1]
MYITSKTKNPFRFFKKQFPSKNKLEKTYNFQTSMSSIITSLKINKNEVVINKKIYDGPYSSIFKGQMLGLNVAVKTINIILSTSETEIFFREVSLLQTLQHKNIIKPIGIFTDNEHLSLVTEYFPGDLDRLIHSPKTLDFSFTTTLNYMQRLQITNQCCQSVIWLHTRCDIVHRNLQPKTFLIDQNLNVKLGDLGFAEVSKGEQNTIEGAPLYCAPEVLKRKGKTGKESDIYSLGITIWEIFYMRRPFEEYFHLFSDDLNTFTKFVDDGLRPVLPRKFLTDDVDQIMHDQVLTIYKKQIEETPIEIDTLIEKCWSGNASKRPTIEDLLKNIFELLSRVCMNEDECVWWEKNLCKKSQIYEGVYDAENFLSILENNFKTSFSKEKKYKEIINKIGEQGEISQKRFSFLCSIFGKYYKKKENYKDMMRVLGEEWYYGNISKEEANVLLEGKEEGTFLIRESSTILHKPLTLSKVENRSVMNTRIAVYETENKNKEYSIETKLAKKKKNNIVDLIDELVELNIVKTPCGHQEC